MVKISIRYMINNLFKNVRSLINRIFRLVMLKFIHRTFGWKGRTINDRNF